MNIKTEGPTVRHIVNRQFRELAKNNVLVKTTYIFITAFNKTTDQELLLADVLWENPDLISASLHSLSAYYFDDPTATHIKKTVTSAASPTLKERWFV
jgi:hypothetical protein